MRRCRCRSVFEGHRCLARTRQPHTHYATEGKTQWLWSRGWVSEHRWEKDTHYFGTFTYEAE